MTLVFDSLRSGGSLILDNLQGTPDTLPSIVSVGTLRDGASCVLTVTNASATGNTVYMDGVVQTITAESAIEITFTVDGTFSYKDSSVGIVIEDDGGFQSAEKTATLLPPTGYRTVILTVAPPADQTSRISSVPDLAIGDQIIYGNVTGTDMDENDVDVFVNGVARRLPAVETMDVMIHDGSQTSVAVTQVFDDPPAVLVTIPDVVGDTQASAVIELQELGLVVVPVFAYSTTVAVGLVGATQPTAGTEVPEGSAIELLISLGDPVPTMPNVVGQSIGTAVTTLMSLGLVAVARYVNDEADFGEVLEQSIAAGQAIDVGSEVNLLVSAGTASDRTSKSVAGTSSMMVFG
jgi:hypothetical protein